MNYNSSFNWYLKDAEAHDVQINKKEVVFVPFLVLEMAKTHFIRLLAFFSQNCKETLLFLVHFLLLHSECPVLGWILDPYYFQDHNFTVACFLKLILNVLVFRCISNRIQLNQMNGKYFGWGIHLLGKMTSKKET